MAPIPLANGRVGCARCNKSMATMAVLKSHHKAIHRHRGRAACTECTWAKSARPSDVLDHLRAAHDIYRAGHPQAFSTDARHIARKTAPLLRRLLAEDRATLAALRGVAMPPAQIPGGWKPEKLAVEIRDVRLLIKQLPGWEAAVDQKRADRVAQ